MLRLRVAATLLLTLHLIVLLWVAWGLPISPTEAKIFFAGHDLVHIMMHLGKNLAPSADFINIRIPFLLLHLINLFLFYQLSRRLLKDEVSVIVSVLIFLFLPGIVSSAVLASSTGLILALYQLFLLQWLNNRKNAAMALLPLFLVVDRSSVVILFALFLYSIYRKERGFALWTLTLFSLSLLIYGFDVQGKPKNYFADTVGLYAAIFSPFLFLYFFYSLYRILIKGEKDIIWFVSFIVLVLSLLFSIRQKIAVQDFAPYVVVAVPLMVKIFFQTYRVRLPIFRRRYQYLAALVLGVLAINTVLLLFHKPLFLLMQEPKKHFAANFYFPYWCAKALKRDGFYKVRVSDKELMYQLEFYGVKSDEDMVLSHRCLSDECKKVSIRYRNRELESCYVSKINSLVNK
ncbi:MAG: hypothetical protein L3J42_00660 [Hydrogenimonas sp.]|nr:hypothetical protein [Hydrogenimonas sp.]